MIEVVKITKTIKTLILEIVGGSGPAHIKEVHLQVVEFRPDVPQHTIRARLSEMSRSDDLEERLKGLHLFAVPEAEVGPRARSDEDHDNQRDEPSEQVGPAWPLGCVSGRRRESATRRALWRGLPAREELWRRRPACA